MHSTCHNLLSNYVRIILKPMFYHTHPYVSLRGNGLAECSGSGDRLGVSRCSALSEWHGWITMIFSSFFRFSPRRRRQRCAAPIAVSCRKTYAVCTCSHGGHHCNKLGSQAPRRGMLFLPVLQHCSKIIDMLGDCSNS